MRPLPPFVPVPPGPKHLAHSAQIQEALANLHEDIPAAVAAGGLNPQGDWDAGTAYDERDMVRHAGTSWVAGASTSAGEEPGVAGVWQEFVAGGVSKSELDNATSVLALDVTRAPYNATGDGSTDDTAAVQAAIGAAEAAGGGTVYFPAGTYLVTALTVEAQGVSFVGVSRTASALRTSTGDLVTLDGAARFRCEHLKLRSDVGGGHIFKLDGNLSHGLWHDLRIEQKNGGKSALEGADPGGAGTFNYIDNSWTHIDVEHVAGATVPTFNVRGGAINRNRWVDVRPTFSGDYVWHIESTAPSSYASDNVIDGVTGEVCDGGIFRGRGVRGTRVSFGSYDHSGPVAKHLVDLGPNGSALTSTDNTLLSCRRHGGSLGSGVFDANIQNGRNTLIDCGGASSFAVDLNGQRALVLNGNVSGTNDAATTYVNGFGVTQNGKAVQEVGSTVSVPSGLVSNLGLQFTTDTDNGLYLIAANQWGLVAAGAGVARVRPGIFRVEAAAALEIDGALDHDGSTVGFYGATPVAKQTGVGVDAASIHAALVALGLIAG